MNAREKKNLPLCLEESNAKHMSLRFYKMEEEKEESM